MYVKNQTTAGVASSKIVLYTTLEMKHPYKCPFCKLLIMNKKILEGRKYYVFDDVVSWLTKQLEKNLNKYGMKKFLKLEVIKR